MPELLSISISISISIYLCIWSSPRYLVGGVRVRVKGNADSRDGVDKLT